MKCFNDIAINFGEIDSESWEETTANIKYQCVVTHITPTIDDEAFIKSLTNLDQILESVEVKYTYDGLTEIFLHTNSQKPDLNAFIELIVELSDKKCQNPPQIEINARKNTQSFIPIFDMRKIIEFWELKGLKSTCEKLSKIALEKKPFTVYGLEKSFQTSAFQFFPLDFEGNQIKKTFDRDVVINNRQKTCHFFNESQIELIPDDFHFSQPTNHPELNYLFDSLKLITSLIFICDQSSFLEQTGELNITLKGYKKITGTVSGKEIQICHASKIYFEIYKWIYSGGDIVDKCGLSRNIISLNILDQDFLSIKEATLASIHSGYQVYLKENIDKYIEIKNKLSDFIHESSKKASDIADKLGSQLKASIISLVSFLTSTILIRVLAKDQEKLISDDTYYIFISLSVIAVIIMINTVIDINTEQKRFTKNHQRFKARYSDILAKDDIEKIFNNDIDHNADIAYITKKRNSYISTMTASLIIMHITMALLRS